MGFVRVYFGLGRFDNNLLGMRVLPALGSYEGLESLMINQFSALQFIRDYAIQEIQWLEKKGNGAINLHQLAELNRREF
jgi:hypothetical protein